MYLTQTITLFLLTVVLQCSGQAGRIIGGESVGSDRFPYFTIVRTRRDKGGIRNVTTECGGSLITSDVVLTAAHCFNYENISSVRVIVGIHHESNDTTFERVFAESWTAHSNFSTATGEDDIGLVRLRRSVSAEPIALSFNSSYPEKSDEVIIIGFGKSAWDGDLSEELMRIDVEVGIDQECDSNIRDDIQFCAGGSGEAPCRGDSGGPVIVEGADGDLLVGITSRGDSNCTGRPGVFTRVSAYEQWIKDEACDGNNLTNCSGVVDSTDGNQTEAPPTGGGGFCFAGSNLVDVASRGPVRMQDLQLGDMVMVGQGIYEPIYSFGHLAPMTIATFLQIKTTTSTLRLTHEHMVFTKAGDVVPASRLQVGDYLLRGSNLDDRVESIRTVQERGLYAPFTPSGKLVVNDIMVSSYVSMLEEKDLELGWISLNHQWLSHAVLFPHRLICHHFASCPTEEYSPEGISLWHDQPLKLCLWLLSSGSVARFVLVVVMAFVATVMTVVETLVLFPVLAVLMLVIPAASNLRVKAKQFSRDF